MGRWVLMCSPKHLSPRAVEFHVYLGNEQGLLPWENEALLHPSERSVEVTHLLVPDSRDLRRH